MTNYDQELRNLRIKCRRPVEHLLSGMYHSIFKGFGLEFEDVREYAPGDDVRSIDWKVTARTGVPHIKRFIEEREQSLYILVDTSASMFFGTSERKKRDIANELVTLITLSAIHNADRVGLVLFSDKVEHFIPANRGNSHANRLISDLLEFEAKGKKTDINCALECVNYLTHKKSSVIFVISDFMNTPFNDLAVLSCKHDIIGINITDSAESQLPEVGIARLQDSETGETILLDCNDDAKNSLSEEFLKTRAQLRETFQSYNVDLLEIDSDSDCVHSLMAFFHLRQQRKQNEVGG